MENHKHKKLTSIADVNWNDLIKNQRMRKPRKKKPWSQYWDRRAPSFANHASKAAYPDSFLKIMKPQSGWTVLDMGCGGGTLSLPLASRVREITAVDFSGKMLEVLGAEIQKREIKNIRTLLASWDDDWSAKNIGRYDVAIASRSLSVDDIETAMTKLNRAALKRVYISTIVGDGPFDRRIFEAIGRELIPEVDYIYIYNLLYQMGIYANISFISEETTKTFDRVDTIKNHLSWMLHKVTSEEEDRLDQYLREKMTLKNGKMSFEYRKKLKWAVIWWDKEQQ